MKLQSDTIGELATALSQAQGEFPPIPKNKTAEVPTKTGGRYSYKYADLADVISIVAPVLSKNGLAVIQEPTLFDGRFVLLSSLIHRSGEYKTSLYPLPMHDKPQLMGSEITYARRYTLTAILGIHADEDEDGTLANKEGTAPRVQPRLPPLTEPREFTEARQRREAAEKDAERLLDLASVPDESEAPNAFDALSYFDGDQRPQYAPGSGDDNSPAITQPSDWKTYKCGFGKKYFGLTMKQIGYGNAKKYLAWLEESAQAQNKPLSSSAEQFRTAFLAFEKAEVAGGGR
jgi:hypothetical protein